MSQSHMGRGNLNWGSLPIRLTCGHVSGAFSGLIIFVAGGGAVYYGWCYSWTFSVWLGEKANRSNHREQANNGILTESVLVSTSRFLSWIPALTFLSDVRRSIRQTNSSLPKLPLVRVFSQLQRSRAGHLGHKVPSPWSPGFSLSCCTPWLIKG